MTFDKNELDQTPDELKDRSVDFEESSQYSGFESSNLDLALRRATPNPRDAYFGGVEISSSKS